MQNYEEGGWCGATFERNLEIIGVDILGFVPKRQIFVIWANSDVRFGFETDVCFGDRESVY